MANKIQLRRGTKAKLPTLSSGEPAYTTDTRELFVGTGSGNVNMSGSQWYTGTAMSGTSTSSTYYYSSCPLVKAGDIYLNTTYGYIYQCTTAGSGTSAKWSYKGTIRGPQGATGAKGDDSQAEYSTTPVQIGTWIDGKPVYRVAWTFAAGSPGYTIYQYQDVPSWPVNGEKTILRCSFSCYHNDYSHIVTSLEALTSMITASTAKGKTVYCIAEYIDF